MTPIDPNCGVEVDPRGAEFYGLSSRHSGKTFFFCCPECKRLFDANPELYLSGQAEPAHLVRLVQAQAALWRAQSA